MEELVSLQNIRTQVAVSDWKQAIRKAGEPLVENGDILEKYVEDMIASVIEMGPYMVLTKGFALAHSAPCEAVLRTSVSLINLSGPVDFGSANDPVKVVMCLACVDRSSHIELISKIGRKLMEKGVIDKMAGCMSPQELYLAINDTGKEDDR